MTQDGALKSSLYPRGLFVCWASAHTSLISLTSLLSSWCPRPRLHKNGFLYSRMCRRSGTGAWQPPLDAPLWSPCRASALCGQFRQMTHCVTQRLRSCSSNTAVFRADAVDFSPPVRVLFYSVEADYINSRRKCLVWTSHCYLAVWDYTFHVTRFCFKVA